MLNISRKRRRQNTSTQGKKWLGETIGLDQENMPTINFIQATNWSESRSMLEGFEDKYERDSQIPGRRG